MAFYYVLQYYNNSENICTNVNKIDIVHNVKRACLSRILTTAAQIPHHGI